MMMMIMIIIPIILFHELMHNYIYSNIICIPVDGINNRTIIQIRYTVY